MFISLFIFKEFSMDMEDWEEENVNSCHGDDDEACAPEDLNKDSEVCNAIGFIN